MANSLDWHDGHYGKNFKFIVEFSINSLQVDPRDTLKTLHTV